MARLISGILLIAAALGGCGEASVDCTAVGCGSGVTVWGIPAIEAEADDVTRIEVCADTVCETTRYGGPIGDNASVAAALPKTDSVELTVTIRDPAGKVVATGRVRTGVDVLHPNGPDCPPECRHAIVAFESGRLTARS
ncbi:hypothetical protein OJ997_33835 [Solirubrobacter phytolaccae]|uniref:Uncharacterized protein n=1 Tax=Solirubrobacter phytolaccae TaxID=1404360 RepID=A0A9X3NKL8_9ACTN|nr:hypothetical protein [Solirubrobacter phytolaccae]MDA0185336.1 hypothetical protein [Solirubrobacter phytolaccae]